MIVINEIQGSEGWMRARKGCFTASELSAAAGVSKYMIRTDLLKQKATGITPDIDGNTQALFNKGHAAEAAARSIAEEIIGDDLSPVTGMIEVDGMKLLASFDGITFDGNVIFEHKLYGDDLAAQVGRGVLEPHYQLQVEQQMLVSGAKKCLFMTSDGTEANMKYCWIDAPKSFDHIPAIWKQLERDLENYQHIEHIERPKAEVCIELPALFVHARGEITEHNMEAFGVALTAKLAEVRAIALVTDQDFSNAKEAAKKFRETAKAIALSKEAMLAQTETIGEAARKMDAWAKDLNGTALQLEKDVEREDKSKKEVMVLEGRQAYADHITVLEADIKPIRITLAPPNFAEAIKGKRNYASMHDAIQTMLAGVKIEADAQAKDIRAKLTWIKTAYVGYELLFHDLQNLVGKPMDDMQLAVTSRIEGQKRAEEAKLEAQRAAIQAEEERKATAKAQAEAEAILAAERAKQAEEEAKTRAESEAAAIEERRKTMQIAESAQASRPPVASKVTRINPAANPAARPSDKEIVDAVAAKFGVSFETACVWILEAAEAITTKEAA